MNTFSYNLSETEYLIFCTQNNTFDLYSTHEGSTNKTKIGTFKAGKWLWEDFQQQQLFWRLYSIYRDNFGKAIRAYNRSLKEKPQMYEFQCVRRKFSIKVTKLKRGWNNWFWGLYKMREI